MKASKPIDQVRQLLRDTVKPFRWEDTTLSLWASEGVLDIFRRKPEMTFIDDVEINEPSKVTAPTSDVRLVDRFQNVLENYMCFMAMSRDGEDSPNAALAMTYKQLYDGALR